MIFLFIRCTRQSGKLIIFIDMKSSPLKWVIVKTEHLPSLSKIHGQPGYLPRIQHVPLPIWFRRLPACFSNPSFWVSMLNFKAVVLSHLVLFTGGLRRKSQCITASFRAEQCNDDKTQVAMMVTCARRHRGCAANSKSSWVRQLLDR